MCTDTPKKTTNNRLTMSSATITMMLGFDCPSTHGHTTRRQRISRQIFPIARKNQKRNQHRQPAATPGERSLDSPFRVSRANLPENTIYTASGERVPTSSGITVRVGVEKIGKSGRTGRGVRGGRGRHIFAFLIDKMSLRLEQVM